MNLHPEKLKAMAQGVGDAIQEECLALELPDARNLLGELRGQLDRVERSLHDREIISGETGFTEISS